MCLTWDYRMQGCHEAAGQGPRIAFPTVRDAVDLRAILAAIDGEFEAPLAAIRGALGAVRHCTAADEGPGRHFISVLQMTGDIATLSRRFLDFIDQVEALPGPRPEAVRPDELLAELDRRLLADALDRGVAWYCGAEGVIRPIWTDPVSCIEALHDLASLAIETAAPGESVGLVATAGAGPVLTLESTAREVIADLGTLLEDPLFNRSLCLEEVGSDPGSRFALIVERLRMLEVTVAFDPAADGAIRRIRLRFPDGPGRPAVR